MDAAANAIASKPAFRSLYQAANAAPAIMTAAVKSLARLFSLPATPIANTGAASAHSTTLRAISCTPSPLVGMNPAKIRSASASKTDTTTTMKSWSYRAAPATRIMMWRWSSVMRLTAAISAPIATNSSPTRSISLRTANFNFRNRNRPAPSRAATTSLRRRRTRRTQAAAACRPAAGTHALPKRSREAPPGQ